MGTVKQGNVIAIYDVVDFFVQDYVTKDLLFTADYATQVSLKTDAESLDIRGGIGNPIRVTANHSKTASFESILPLVDMGVLATKLGKAITRGKQIVPENELLFVDTTAGTASLSNAPATGTLKVYTVADNGRDVIAELKSGTPTSDETKYSIDAKVITVNTALKGKLLRVIYSYETVDNTPLVRVTGSDFANYCVISGKGYSEDELGVKSPVVFVCYRAKPTPEFEITFKSGEATNVPFNCNLSVDLVGNESAYFDIVPLIHESWSRVTLGGES